MVKKGIICVFCRKQCCCLVYNLYLFHVDFIRLRSSGFASAVVCVCVCVCFHVLIRVFPPGSVPFGAVQAADSSSQWLCCGWRAGTGPAGRFESGGGERHHGGVLSEVWYV